MTDLDLLRDKVMTFHRTRTWRLDEREKDALARLSKTQGYTLNKYCGNCVTKALKVVYQLYATAPCAGHANHKGNLEKMTLKQLNEMRKELGAKSARSKAQLIENILEILQ